MKSFIYQSPKKDGPNNTAPRSAPIPESNAFAWKALEAAGWTVVEVIDDGVSKDSVFVPAAEGLTPPTLPPVPPAPLARFDFLKPDQIEALAAVSLGTEVALRAATDDQLKDVKGIGEGTIRNLRAALKEPATPPVP